MKESKFIELLNLYVDHQISPADAAWLESEIQRQPERRQIYRQYCQMQKACLLLAENFRTTAPAVAGGKVIEFQPRTRRIVRATYGLGALAAAACVALVVMNRRNLFTAGDAAQQVTASQPVQMAEAAVTPPAADASGLVALPVRAALQPAFAGLMRVNASTNTAQAGNDRANFEWMTRVRLDRVSADPQWFEAQPTLQTQELMFHARPSSQTQAENAAFRFQR